MFVYLHVCVCACTCMCAVKSPQSMTMGYQGSSKGIRQRVWRVWHEQWGETGQHACTRSFWSPLLTLLVLLNCVDAVGFVKFCYIYGCNFEAFCVALKLFVCKILRNFYLTRLICVLNFCRFCRVQKLLWLVDLFICLFIYACYRILQYRTNSQTISTVNY